jgi:hypothetical protein
MRWGIDVSKWQSMSLDQWRLLVDQGCAFAIIKFSQNNFKDPMLEKHIDMCDKVGVPYGAYHWADPIYPVDAQVATFTGLVQQYKPKCAFGDYEQYWRSWKEWWDVHYKRSTYMSVFSPTNLYVFYRKWALSTRDWLQTNAPEVHFGLYSAAWFVDRYCPSIGILFRETGIDHYWNRASKNFYDPDKNGVLDWKHFPTFMQSLDISGIPLPKTVQRPYLSIWQVNEIPLEGLPKLDFNVMTEERYTQLFGERAVVPVPPVEVPPAGAALQFRVNTDMLNIRKTPAVLKTNDIGDAIRNQVFEVKDIGGSDAWIQTDAGWMCVQKGTVRYMVKK